MSIEIDKYKVFATEKRLNKLKDVLEKRQKKVTVILENINDPHNISAALRSCDAVGIDKVYLIYTGKQPIPKLGKKSSSSAIKWVDTELFNSVEDCFEKLKNNGVKIYTTHMSSNSKSIYDLDLTENIALVFGNEHSGVSDESLNMADGNFLIPQVGMIQSLNISVAVAVSVYEVYRQKYLKGDYLEPSFNQNELKQKFEQWIRK